jgi:hypothetical protein
VRRVVRWYSHGENRWEGRTDFGYLVAKLERRGPDLWRMLTLPPQLPKTLTHGPMERHQFNLRAWLGATPRGPEAQA